VLLCLRASVRPGARSVSMISCKPMDGISPNFGLVDDVVEATDELFRFLGRGVKVMVKVKIRAR